GVQCRRPQRLAQRAVSARVTLTVGPTRYRLPRWRIATMLQLPTTPGERLTLGGTAASAYFRSLARAVGRAPRNADFAVYANGVRIVPSRPGVTLDVRRSATAVL